MFMKRHLKHIFLVSLTLLFFAPKQAKATHAAGGELIYEWVSDSTYRFYLKFYRDCQGIDAPPNQLICGYNTCDGYTLSATMQRLVTLPDGSPNGSEVSPGCPGYPTVCAGGTLPGYREWWYSTTFTLPSRCDSWTFYIGINARNNAIGNLTNPGSQTLYIEAKLNNSVVQNASSPYFTVKPVPYTCLNIPFTYNNGAVDPNNDSLVFDIIQPRTGPTNCTNNPAAATDIPFVAAAPAYNLVDNPFPTNNTFVVSPATGQESFTPSQQGVFVFTTRVKKYRAGQLLSVVIRDIQIVITTCNVPQPAVNVDQASLVGSQYANNQIEGCATQNFSFCFKANSPDTGAILVVTDNHTTAAPGSNITYTNQYTDIVTGCFNWVPTATDTGLHVLTITVKDSTCRPPGIPITQTFVIPVYVWPITQATGDTTICNGETAHLDVNGGTSFTWSVISGDAASLTCPTCKSNDVTPAVTTSYKVVSNISSFCNRNSDTVVIKVVKNPSFSAGVDTTTCVNNSQPFDIHLVPDTSTAYSVVWNPPTFLDNPNSSTPVATPVGNVSDITYVITVTSNILNRCTANDTVNLHILQGYTIFNHDTAICHGDSVQINATGDAGYTYSWNPQLNVYTSGILNPVIVPDTTGTYTISASFPGCRDSLTSRTIEVQPIPVITLSYPDTAVCYGAKTYMTASIGPSWFTDYNYSWSPAQYVDNPLSLHPYTLATATRVFTLTVTTPIGCKAVDSTKVSVIPFKFVHASPDTAICPRDKATLRAYSDTTVVLQRAWWTPDYGISDTVGFNVTVWPNSDMLYTLYAVDTNGCLDSALVKVSVRPGAVINLPDSVTIYPGEAYQMNPGTNCSYFHWFPATGLSADTISNPLATPEVATRYILTGSTDIGCSTSDSIDVNVINDANIDIPNAFSPGSAPNDIFKVLHKGNATLKSLVIYDRWGVKMFESHNIDEGWDGTYKGKPQPMGVYVYMVEAVSPTGRKFVKQGNLTLLR
jgi:gliding motility-associated-like protein